MDAAVAAAVAAARLAAAARCFCTRGWVCRSLLSTTSWNSPAVNRQTSTHTHNQSLGSLSTQAHHSTHAPFSLEECLRCAGVNRRGCQPVLQHAPQQNHSPKRSTTALKPASVSNCSTRQAVAHATVWAGRGSKGQGHTIQLQHLPCAVAVTRCQPSCVCGAGEGAPHVCSSCHTCPVHSLLPGRPPVTRR